LLGSREAIWGKRNVYHLKMFAITTVGAASFSVTNFLHSWIL
jgi:hypothetical protein